MARLDAPVEWTVLRDDVAAIDTDSAAEAAVIGSAPGVTSVTARIGKRVVNALIGVSIRRAISRPLRVDSLQFRYFIDADGLPVYLTGSHTWNNFQDMGPELPLSKFDYAEYLNTLQRNGHNVFRLWVSEQANWTAEIDGDYWIEPNVYQRRGPEIGRDGKPRFDLDRFNQVYFDRLRERVMEAQERGIYVSVMLFNGWSVERKGRQLGNPWDGHPFNGENNVNGIDGDMDRDRQGLEVHRAVTPEVLEYQDGYVRKVIDTLNDLDNVLYEISNESRGGSAMWQHHMIELIKQYEATLPKQHPVGMTVERPGESHDVLFDSSADWVSPWRTSTNALEPSVNFSNKVIIYDTDHLCGVCGTEAWVWKSLVSGVNPIVMDPYDRLAVGMGALDDKRSDDVWRGIRRNLGYSRVYAERMDLRAAEPLPGLSSSGYCLASPQAEKPEYLVFLPEGGDVEVDLSASDSVSVEWFDPSSGELRSEPSVPGGGRVTFHSESDGPAVLFLERATL